MHKLSQLFGRNGGCYLLCLLAAAVALASGQVSAQTLSNADFTTLQNYLGNGSGPRTIILAFDDTLVANGPLEVFFDTVLDASGHKVTISGNNRTPLFIVDPGVKFIVTNLTMSGANNTGAAGTGGATGSNGGNNGGSGGTGLKGDDALGGAVNNQGDSTFVNCLFLTNRVVGGAGGVGGNGGNGNNVGGNGGNGGAGGLGYGGGIYNLGTLLLSNCSFAGNVVTGGLGGPGGTNGTGDFQSFPGSGAAGGIGAGAGIYNLGKVTIINSTLNQNISLSGASQAGGGSLGGNGNGNPGPAGPDSQGGGICNLGTNTVINCTFFANTVTGGAGGVGGTGNNVGGHGGNGGNARGGGIYNGPGSTSTVTNCTFSGDVVAGGTNGVAGPGSFTGSAGSPGTASGANIANAGVTFSLKNTILNKPTNATSAFGTIIDLGNNISSDATPTFTTTNSFNSKDPKLSLTGLAANNSATVLTIALSPGSPAIDAIHDGSAPPLDEREFARVGLPDIGAFEFGAAGTNFNVSGIITSGTTPLAGITVSAGSISAVSHADGSYSLPLPQNTTFSISPTPSAFFNPHGFSLFVTTNTNGVNFQATNAVVAFSVVTGTNTNTSQVSFAGTPTFGSFHIQATTNLLTNGTVWTNIATNTFGSTNMPTFTFLLSGTNLTNFEKRFFRAVSP